MPSLPLFILLRLTLPSLLFPRLRTLSSGGGSSSSSNKSPSGGTSGGGTGGGGDVPERHSPLKHSQSYNSFVSPVKQPPTTPTGLSSFPTTATVPVKKFPLATHRYGKEELLQLFSEDLKRPDDIPDLSPLTRVQLLTPLSFMPLSEEEQVRLWVAPPIKTP